MALLEELAHAGGGVNAGILMVGIGRSRGREAEGAVGLSDGGGREVAVVEW